jgi:hypothetical protein
MRFGYRSILVSLSLKRVPHLHLQVEWNIPVPRDPQMKWWCDLMSQHLAGPIIKYNDTFFYWLEPQILMIDDYAYARLDFRHDLDLVLPEGSHWGDLGKIFFFSFMVFL